MPWRLIIKRRAIRDLDGLSESDRESVHAAISRLTTDLSGLDVRKLAGREGEWRLRVGQWRVILELRNQSGEIIVLRVLHRREAYRG